MNACRGAGNVLAVFVESEIVRIEPQVYDFKCYSKAPVNASLKSRLRTGRKNCHAPFNRPMWKVTTCLVGATMTWASVLSYRALSLG